MFIVKRCRDGGFMKKASKRANGEGTIYFDENKKTWRAEIQWVDSAGVAHRKSWKDKKQTAIKI